jgi:hypothetical protein
MNEERQARKLLKELNDKRGTRYYDEESDEMVYATDDESAIISQLNSLPHVPNKKEAKIIRKLKLKSGIKSTKEIYEKFGKVIGEELKRLD